MMNENDKEIRENEPNIDEKKPDGLDEIEEIVIEELAVDGICGIYGFRLNRSSLPCRDCFRQAWEISN